MMNHGKDLNMKFTDGYWQIRPTMIPPYAAQVYDVEIEPDAITTFPPTKELSGRARRHDQPADAGAA